MATKAAVLAILAAQLHEHTTRVGVERITTNAIDLMVVNAIRIEDAIDAHLKAAKETK